MARNRRGRGENGITQRADGRWMAQGSRVTASGKRERPTFYGATKQEALAKLEDAKSKWAGDPADKRQTVAQYLARWLRDIRGSVEPTTWQRYDVAVRNQLVPGLGRVLLLDLAPAHVQ